MSVEEPVTKLMTTPVHSITVDQHLSDARRIMTRARIHHVPVVDGRRLVGLISASDIMSLGYGEAPEPGGDLAKIMDLAHAVADVMQRDLVTIGDGQSVRKAAELLSTGSFHALPVVDENRELLGMITSTDLVRYLAKLV